MAAFQSALPEAAIADLKSAHSLLEFGADSVSLIKLQHLLNSNLKADITVQELYEAPSFEAIKARVFRTPVPVSSNSSNSKPISSPPGVAPRFSSEDDFRETSYDEVIQGFVPLANLAKSLSWPPRAILLTGGTGFLGTYILAELLLKSDALIYVLARGKDPKAVLSSLIERMEDVDLPWDERWRGRIKVVRPFC